MSTPPDQMPPPAPSATPPEPPDADDPVTPTGSVDDRNLAMLAHLSGILFCIIVPLIVWLVNKDRPDKEYLVTEAKEALNFQISVLIAYIICWVLTLIVIGGVLFWLVWIANLVFCIMAAMQVSRSGSYRYPYCLRLVN